MKTLVCLLSIGILSNVVAIGAEKMTAAIGLPLDAFVITRAAALNGMGGLVFGWFYWTYGLEAAMICHFSGDIVLHVAWPFPPGA